MALYLDMCVGDTLQVGEAKLLLEKKSGRKARFKISADNNEIDVKLHQRPVLPEGIQPCVGPRTTK